MPNIKIRKQTFLIGFFIYFFLGTVSAQSNGPNGVSKVIFFDYEDYVVKPEFENAVKAHADFLIANPNLKVSIEAHTEDKGSYEYNLSLAQKRAKAVTNSLLKLGVLSVQIESVAFGSVKPADEGNNEAAFAKNRRVEFFYR